MITIIDYQMGNLRSVQKAFERIGCAAVITSDPRTVASADRVVLPGVGAFRDAISELRRRDLVSPIRDAIASGTPFLGICLGLQLLFDVSYEDGEWAGLGVLAGHVERFPARPGHKVPHMGWNQVEVRQRVPILADTASGDYFYFVHSYFAVPSDPNVVALETRYPDPFCSAVSRDNLFACQFHPEKSQANGQKLLARFASRAGR
jgi:glutamine amidotransferase